ncbi:hypothetical protein GV791_21350 [Nocardia cyriacigeorgica]|uniref:Uncharacterized protein n=1 Tax=Nocardia cyriacigeorgica TaxID=135487 RepID=A0A6P1CRB5_9NOCA|nr:hypothetical protein [Nocardia cyriacigeorgica]MBF6288721.1 hypothetical protein [Nocardia cyriacigeorgica]NEW35089.1 hypothetical protein [Nocardia cyriacigeorgica]
MTATALDPRQAIPVDSGGVLTTSVLDVSTHRSGIRICRSPRPSTG